jgi:hypothetical protein
LSRLPTDGVVAPQHEVVDIRIPSSAFSNSRFDLSRTASQTQGSHSDGGTIRGPRASAAKTSIVDKSIPHSSTSGPAIVEGVKFGFGEIGIQVGVHVAWAERSMPAA